MATKKTYPQPRKVRSLNHPQKYVGDVSNIVLRSSWERKFVHWCDNNASVIQWTSEECVVPYYSRADQKVRRYFVDFVVKYQDVNGSTRTLMVEIKPNSQTKAPTKGRKREQTYLREQYEYAVNQDKWEAATRFAKERGWEFVVLDEYDLGLSKRPVKK